MANSTIAEKIAQAESERQRIAANIAAAYTEAEAKGATMPATENSANLPTAIRSIPEAVQPTLIPKQITENGTYTAAEDNADGYDEVTVDVVDTKFVDLVQRTATSINDFSALKIGSNAFYSYSSLENVHFQNAISIGQYSFQSCTGLTKIEFPNLQDIGFAAFRYCRSLTTADFPNVTAIKIGAFQSTGLRTLILHRRASLSGEPMSTIPTSCIVYVENSDLEWYSTATNWSAIYADGRIKSIDELPPEEATT